MAKVSVPKRSVPEPSSTKKHLLIDIVVVKGTRFKARLQYHNIVTQLTGPNMITYGRALFLKGSVIVLLVLANVGNIEYRFHLVPSWV